MKKLPVDYDANKTVWMTRDLFTNWLKKWDIELQKEKKRVLLLIDNCTVHENLPVQKNIKGRRRCIYTTCRNDQHRV